MLSAAARAGEHKLVSQASMSEDFVTDDAP